MDNLFSFCRDMYLSNSTSENDKQMYMDIAKRLKGLDALRELVCAGYNLRRFRQILDADRYGRCVIAPTVPGEYVETYYELDVWQLMIGKDYEKVFAGETIFPFSEVGKTVIPKNRFCEPSIQAEVFEDVIPLFTDDKVSPHRAQVLMDAEREGHCLILPYVAGDILTVKGQKYQVECVIVRRKGFVSVTTNRLNEDGTVSDDELILKSHLL